MDKEKVKDSIDAYSPEAADSDGRTISSRKATDFHGFGLFHCMTQSLARGGSGLGTCLGPSGTEKVVREAGFRGFRMLDLKSQTNLFYAATP